MFAVAAILSIVLIVIISIMATKRRSTEKILLGWMLVCFMFLIYSLSLNLYRNSPEWVEQFEAVVSTCREFVFI